MPLVSIITPTWNACRYLPATYASLCAQSVADWEWLVGDDGSTDGTAEYLRGLEERDPRVRHLRLPHGGLPAYGRNAGLRAARGEFIAFLDADDLFHPEKLARQLAQLRQDPGRSASFHHVESFWSEELHRTDAAPSQWKCEPFLVASFDHLIAHGNFAPTSSLMIRRSLAELVGPMSEDPEPPPVEDYDYVLRLARITPLHRLEGEWGRYRMHGASTWASQDRTLAQRFANFDRVARMLAQNGHLQTPSAPRFWERHFTARAELLLQSGDAACRREFLCALRHAPLRPKRWFGLLSYLMPIGSFAPLYASAQARYLKGRHG